MKKALLPIVACLAATTVVLTTGKVANPDTTTVIPYPEVLNLKRVPIFNDKGMVAQALAEPLQRRIDTKIRSPKIAAKAKVVPERIVKDVILPVKIATTKPPEQYSAKKMRELLLEHQTLSEIAIDPIK
jgi:hypothetical protein